MVPAVYDSSAGKSSIALFVDSVLSGSSANSNPQKSLHRDSSHIGIARIDGDPIIISFLKGESGRYAMIVNRNPGRQGQIKVQLQNHWQATEIDKSTGKAGSALGVEFDLAFEPGDGRLLKLEREME